MFYPSFYSDTYDGKGDDLRTPFVNHSKNVNEISYNRLFQENKDKFFCKPKEEKNFIFKLLKKPTRETPFINQYKLIHLPNKNTTTISNCTNSNTKIKLAVSPMNKLVALKQYKKGSNSPASSQSASHNNVSLKLLNNYMDHNQQNINGQLVRNVTPEQANRRVQFDKLAWEFYIYQRIEYGVSKRLDKSSNIVEFYGIIDSNESNKVWFIFEYCELGETVWEFGYFSEFLNKIWNKCYGFSNTPGFLSNFVIIKFLQDCLKGLDFLNGIGISHRDIKPSNVLVQKTLYNGFTFKISDFETALVSVDKEFPDIENLPKNEIYKKYQNEVNKLIGSPMFIAPEICSFVIPELENDDIKKELKIDTTCNITLLDPMKLDCWALGVSLYCLLKGRKPFRMETGGSEFDLYRRINTDDIMDEFKTQENDSRVYDLDSLRKELVGNDSMDTQTKKIVELTNFTILEICEQLLVKSNSKRKRASEILETYGSYLTFIEESLSQLVIKAATNGNLELSNDNIASLIKKSPFRLKSSTSFKSNSSYSNSGESLNIITSPSSTAHSAGVKFKKFFHRTGSRGSYSVKSPKSVEKLDISGPLVPQYLSFDSDTSPVSNSNQSVVGSLLNSGKYIDLQNVIRKDAENNSDDGFLSITSSDGSYVLSDSDGTDDEGKELKIFEKSRNSASKLPTPYSYGKLQFSDDSSNKSLQNSAIVPKRSPMRQVSAGPPETEATRKKTLPSSLKTINFKKYLDQTENIASKISANRLTVMNVRDSILNFENVDALKKYLSFADGTDI
ncbi:hypothetical protein QEN19_002766 [Hanseniaspora menglaensis]